MKHMCLILAFLLALLSMNALSEETISADIGMYEALEFMNAEMLSVAEVYEAADTESEKQLLMYCLQEMALAQVGISATMSDDAADIYGYSAAPENNEEELTIFRCYESESTFVNEYGCRQSYKITAADGYFSLNCISSNDEDNSLEKYISIETAYRPGTAEMLILLKVYEEDGILSSTSRHLLHVNENESEHLSTRTLGQTFDLAIDLYKWSIGEEYSWNVDLLFPEVLLMDDYS